jgi:uracil-DNA glycosylase
MKGCTSILRLLLGKSLGADYEGEFVELDGEPTHLFDCFALVNFLLCSAVPAEPIGAGSARGGRRGQSTPAMQRNCARHLTETLRILEPTIIVLQGRGVLRWMKSTFSALSDDLVQTIPINGSFSRVLSFTHPSTPNWARNWGNNHETPYLLEDVAPQVRQILMNMDAEENRDN